ncbi:MAG: ATP-binding cassette domain-containing protein [Bacteriovoracaceae bacterium]|nr:ATP-binding cassette domain-containing protein [Bacteriovoracaceae bacterium]
MIQLQEISKSFGERVLFEDVNFVVGPRERIGLVGRNGMGKSTLFRIILGEESSDSGSIAIPKGYRLGALEQHLNFTGKTILEEVIQALPQEFIYDHWRGEKILFGLGFGQEDLERPPSDFSGGYQIRVKLAKVLVSQPGLLLLDEPTNYLDIVSLRWLAQFLKDFPGEVLMITHDRSFMDKVCTHTVGIHRRKVKKIKGGTNKYYEQLEIDEEIYEQTRLNQERKKQELEGFIKKFGAKATKARQANSKKKIIEKMDEIEVLDEVPELRFSFNYKDIPSKFPMEVKDLSFGYDSSELLFEDLNFSISKGDRIGIIGKNGKGKSTLLNVLAGELSPINGSIRRAPGVSQGHFGQTNIERLHNQNTITQEVASANVDLSFTNVRSICGAMMFPGDDAEKPISVLSGGEKARVMLGKILAGKSNILLLDEPTNHLDMESIEVLCQEIDRFPGAAFVVTHSELLLDKLVNKMVVFKDGRAFLFEGTYKDFLNKIGWDDDVVEEKPVKKVVNTKITKVPQSEESTKNIKIKIEVVEEDIMKLEGLIEQYENLCQEKSSKGDDIHEVSAVLGKLHKKIEEKFGELESLSEQLD